MVTWLVAAGGWVTRNHWLRFNRLCYHFQHTPAGQL